MGKKNKNKIFVVVNPEAGGGLGRRLWPQVSRELEKKIGPFEFEETNAVGHGRLLAAEAAQAGCSLVISYGGDGTIHEVVNGICESKSQPVLGLLCAGTGGDFIKTLGIPGKLSDQIQAVAGRQTRQIDLGRIEYTNRNGKKEKRLFINIANAGIGGEVVRRVHIFQKIFGRKTAYLFATLSSFLSWHPRKIEIRIENAKKHLNGTRKLYSVIIANGRYFGGGMPIAPDADPADGYFDLVSIGEINPVLGTLLLPLLYSKQLHRLSNVRTGRAKKVWLRSDEPVGLDIDGEPIGSLPATFEIVPKALEIRVP